MQVFQPGTGNNQSNHFPHIPEKVTWSLNTIINGKSQMLLSDYFLGEGRLYTGYLQELKNVKRKAKWIYSLTNKIAQNQHITEQQIIHDYLISLYVRNRPLPSSKIPHFQNEARCTTFLVTMSFICMRMKSDFHIKG